MKWFSGALCALLCVACGAPPDRGRAEPVSASEPALQPAREQAPTLIPASSAAALPRVVFLGDSLTAGYGLEPGEAYPSLLQARLRNEGYGYEVVNAGVSGDTSAGGLRRLDWALDGNVQVLVVALGGNDGLRGLPVTDLRQNLTTIISRSQARGITVLLAGMEAPPNFGADYTSAFRAVYRDLAREYRVALVPFLLEGVAGNPALNIRDGIHPNPQGARLVEATIWQALEPLLRRTPR